MDVCADFKSMAGSIGSVLGADDPYMARLYQYRMDPESGLDAPSAFDRAEGVENAAQYFSRQLKLEEELDRKERREKRKEIKRRMQKAGLIKDDETLKASPSPCAEPRGCAVGKTC